MTGKSSSVSVFLQWASRHRLSLSIAACVAILLLAGAPVWAADGSSDIYETVPPATPQAPVPPPPEPTPRPKDNDSNDENAAPTAQPGPTSEAASAPAAGAGSDMTAVVSAAAANVRQGPGTAFPIIGTLAGGNTVTVVGRNSAGTWWNICCLPGTETRGWISAQLVTPNFGADQAAALPITEAAPADTVEQAMPAATNPPAEAATPAPTEVQTEPATSVPAAAATAAETAVATTEVTANNEVATTAAATTPEAPAEATAEPAADAAPAVEAAAPVETIATTEVAAKAEATATAEVKPDVTAAVEAVTQVGPTDTALSQPPTSMPVTGDELSGGTLTLAVVSALLAFLVVGAFVTRRHPA